MRRKYRSDAELWRKTRVAAREMRANPTVAERLLWEYLRDRRLDGHKFRRQHPIGRFLVDFCCPERQLAVELDGAAHAESGEIDALRTVQLEQFGFHVLRFANAEVENSMDAVLARIRQALQARVH